MLIETAQPRALASATEETDLGPLSWFISMLAAFAMLVLTLVGDRVGSWLRPPPSAR